MKRRTSPDEQSNTQITEVDLVQIEETLLKAIQDLAVTDNAPPSLTVDEPLLNGKLDSLGILRLVSFIEEDFNIRVSDEELIPENFESVKRIADYIRRQKNLDG